MTDITKCNDEDCPMKKKCYRWWSEEGVWQSYFKESPREGDECEYFWERKRASKHTKLRT